MRPRSIIIHLQSHLFICFEYSNILLHLANLSTCEKMPLKICASALKKINARKAPMLSDPFRNRPVSNQLHFNANGNVLSMRTSPENNQSAQLSTTRTWLAIRYKQLGEFQASSTCHMQPPTPPGHHTHTPFYSSKIVSNVS